MDNKETTYEEASAALAKLVEKLEKGDLSLDETVKTYAQAQKLSAECVDLLEKAKLKITQIGEQK